MWFVTLLGLAVIAPPTDAQLPPLVRPLVESLIADGERRSPATARPLALPAGTKTIAVEFTAPTFLAPSALQFEYKLSGVDEKWRTTGHRRSIQFGHLPPGAYDFAVRLGRPHGDPAHETSVAFTIAPHFFRTTMFLLTVGALVLVLVLVGHRLRIRQVAGRFRAIQTERGRIARDLHDGLAQSFTAIGYHLDALAATNKGVPETQALVEQTRTIVDHSHAQMRRSIWDLRAEGQEAGTFAERLAALTAELRSAHTSITVRCGDLPALSTLVQHEALLVAREAVTNALRHAKAAHIAVAARWEEAGFHLVVEDDGGGFGTPGARPPDHSHGGFGIIGMKERAARLDGTLSIAAGTQGGTAVTLFVPAAAARTDEERS